MSVSLAGTFADKTFRKTAAATTLAASVADQIAVRQSETKTQSHTAGFEVRCCSVCACPIRLQLVFAC